MISKLLNTLNNALDIAKPPLTPIPAPLLLTGANNRSGLIASEIVANIISRKGEGGVLSEDDANVDITNSMELIRVEEILKAIRENAKVEIVIPMGVPVQATGANAGGPVTVIGTTIQTAKGYGIIR